MSCGLRQVRSGGTMEEYMPNRPENFHRVVVEGIDGSGKSTMAQQAAALLSRQYPKETIRVADTTSVSSYVGGELAHVLPSRRLELWSASNQPLPVKLAQTGLFAIGRQYSEWSAARHANTLTIGVRDPYRIDPAVHVTTLGIKRLSSMDAEQRLQLFDRFTRAPHPSLVVLMKVDPNAAGENIRLRAIQAAHETPEMLETLAMELPRVIEANDHLFDVPAIEINALKDNTADLLAMVAEEFVPRPRS